MEFVLILSNNDTILTIFTNFNIENGIIDVFMKPLPFKIPKASSDALIVQEDRVKVLYDQYHQHEEIQISLVVRGEGKLVVGDTLSSFQSGDVLVFGSKVPHLFKTEYKGYETFMISLFFTKASFGSYFFDLPELKKAQAFFDNADNGFSILLDSDIQKVHTVFTEIVNTRDKLKRFILFLQVIEIMSKASKKRRAQNTLQRNYKELEGKRMAMVFQKVIQGFAEDISLAEVASLANMTPNAFCRYFKKRTNKTFFTFLAEIRINNAAQLLLAYKDLTITEAAYQSGFKNLSNFNRKFKEFKSISPSQYRKEYMY